MSEEPLPTRPLRCVLPFQRGTPPQRPQANNKQIRNPIEIIKVPLYSVFFNSQPWK